MNTLALKGLLAERLEAHDWYFAFTDDFNQWKKGQKEQDEIRSLVKALGKEGEKMYDDHTKNMEL